MTLDQIVIGWLLLCIGLPLFFDDDRKQERNRRG